MTVPAVRIRDLVFAWPGGPAVLEIDRFEMAAGEAVFLAGASGSGKSVPRRRLLR